MAERPSKCLGTRMRPATTGGDGKSVSDSFFTWRCSVITSGDGLARSRPTPGSITTAQPSCRPDGIAMMSPGTSSSSTEIDSARRSALRERAASASRAPIDARSRAYSSKSPRSQAASAHSAAIFSLLRVAARARPTTDLSDWYCANDCSSSPRAFSRPTRATMFTAML